MIYNKDHNFERAVQRVAQVLGMEPRQVTALGKFPRTVKARALLCFWAQRKLGVSAVEISEKLSACQSAASRLSMRGERFASEQKVELVDTKA